MYTTGLYHNGVKYEWGKEVIYPKPLHSYPLTADGNDVGSATTKINLSINSSKGNFTSGYYTNTAVLGYGADEESNGQVVLNDYTTLGINLTTSGVWSMALDCKMNKKTEGGYARTPNSIGFGRNNPQYLTFSPCMTSSGNSTYNWYAVATSRSLSDTYKPYTGTTLDGWSRVVVTKDGTSWNCYVYDISGIQIHKQSFNLSIDLQGTSHRVVFLGGGYHWTAWCSGTSVKNFNIWDKALTEEESNIYAKKIS